VTKSGTVGWTTGRTFGHLSPKVLFWDKLRKNLRENWLTQVHLKMAAKIKIIGLTDRNIYTQVKHFLVHAKCPLANISRL